MIACAGTRLKDAPRGHAALALVLFVTVGLVGLHWTGAFCCIRFRCRSEWRRQNLLVLVAEMACEETLDLTHEVGHKLVEAAQKHALVGLHAAAGALALLQHA